MNPGMHYQNDAGRFDKSNPLETETDSKGATVEVTFVHSVLLSGIRDFWGY